MQLTQIKHSLIAGIMCFSFAYTGSSLADANDLPDLGASALSVLSIEKERQLGALIFTELQGQSSVLLDPIVEEYLNALGNKLVAHADGVNFPFRFFGVNNPQVNAFAFYGGYIGVHAGLISETESESQLASVLAHEIAHVTQRHLARKKQAAMQQSNLTLAGVIGSILLAAINPQAMMASLMATTASAQQAQTNYTRANEQEADNLGMNILARAGFDPYAAADFFAIMLDLTRYRTKPPQFLVTHPLEESRVTDAHLRAQQFERRFYPHSLDFLLVRARIQARYIYNKDQVIDIFTDRVAKSHHINKTANLYGLALAYLDNGEFEKALETLLPLNKLDPNNLYYLDALSDIYIGLKNYQPIIEQLDNAYKLRPNNSVVTLNFANVLIEANQTEQAIKLLEYYLLQRPNEFLATQLLRSAYKKVENDYRYHATSAQFSALRADYQAAIRSTDLALSTIDPNNKAEINRLEALKIQYRERLKYLKNMKGV